MLTVLDDILKLDNIIDDDILELYNIVDDDQSLAHIIEDNQSLRPLEKGYNPCTDL